MMPYHHPESRHQSSFCVEIRFASLSWLEIRAKHRTIGFGFCFHFSSNSTLTVLDFSRCLDLVSVNGIE
ncbi:hypothetical protein QYF36_004785 [Acer negundo]|nr:hypothetical protein QYF36_004785 [Acer negundo]